MEITPLNPTAPPLMRQVAPYPEILAGLVKRLRYRRHLGWAVFLEDDCTRDMPGRHGGEARGMTLIVQRVGPNTYNPDQQMIVNHYFAVPAATYNYESWLRWLFERLGDVDTHERMEDFAIASQEVCDHDRLVPSRPCGECQKAVTRPYAPNHGPGWDPYLITVERTELDRRTAYTGEVNDH